MSTAPIKVETATRLSRNLGLMQAGSVITIDIATPAGQKGKFRTIFVGYLPKKYVLVQFPDSKKMGNFGQFITQGVGVTVRGLIEGQEGCVAAFVTSIKQTLQLPSKLIVLDFPKTISMQSLRKSIRIDTDISSKVRIDKNVWEGMITDISSNGCQVLVNNGEEISLAKDKAITIVIDSYGDLSNIKVSGQICSIKPVTNGVSLGIKFSESSKSSVTKLLHQVVISED